MTLTSVVGTCASASYFNDRQLQCVLIAPYVEVDVDFALAD